MIKRRAFTLIELLVVIAIIALLMGIMMPVLGTVKEQARCTICQTNLHQYGLAERMYIDANHGYFSPIWSWLYDPGSGQPGLDNVGCQWHNASLQPDGLLWPYLKEKDIHMCPTFKSFARHMPCPNPKHDTSIPIEPQYSYSKNAYLGGDAPSFILMETQVVRPSGVVVFSEENTWVIGDDENGWTPNDLSSAALNDNVLFNRGDKKYHSYAIGGGGDCFATYHLVSSRRRNHGYGNAVFVDGHVERVCSWEPPDNVFSLLWPNKRK